MSFQIKLFLLFIVFLNFSCSKPSELGLTLVEQEQSDVVFTDSTQLILQTALSPAQSTLNTARVLVGEFDDPIFGKTTASVYMNFSLPSTNISFPNASYDSLVLSLEFDTTGHYGNILNNPSTQSWEVYRIEETLELNTEYDSDATFAIGQVLNSSVRFSPNYTDSINIEEDGSAKRRAAQLRIRLDDAFGRELINPSDPTIYSSNENFKNFFKGVLIRPTAGANNNSLIRFRTESANMDTRLTLYYTDSETNGTQVAKSYIFSAISDVETVLNIQHDYTTSDILDNNPTDTLVYLQGGDGVGVRVDLSAILNLGAISINKAELYVYPIDGDPTDFPIPSQLVCKYRRPDGSLDFVDDVYTSFSRLGTYELSGGLLNKADAHSIHYKMNISEYLQRVVKGEITDNSLYIQTVAVIDPSRVRLGNHKNNQNTSKLLLTYTKIQ